MTVELLKLQDAINDVRRLIDEAWEVASMMSVAASVADVEAGTAASALARILELAQVRGRVVAKTAAGLNRQASKSKR